MLGIIYSFVESKISAMSLTLIGETTKSCSFINLSVPLYHRLPIIIVITAIIHVKIATTTIAGIHHQKGRVTYHHDQSILSKSLSVTKTTPNNPNTPIPLFVDELLTLTSPLHLLRPMRLKTLLLSYCRLQARIFCV